MLRQRCINAVLLHESLLLLQLLQLQLLLQQPVHLQLLLLLLLVKGHIPERTSAPPHPRI